MNNDTTTPAENNLYIPQDQNAMKSNTIAKLACALAKAQGAMKPAVKDAKNPFFKSSYADLASVWEAARGPLSSNGLAVIQTLEQDLTNKVTVVTLLAHESGEWIQSKLSMKPLKDDPQGLGSCITYNRRYSLAAIVGVAPEDDDGNAASNKNMFKEFEPKRISQQQPPPPEDEPVFYRDEPPPFDQPENNTPIPPAQGNERKISQAQAKRLFAIAHAGKVAVSDVKDYIRKEYNIQSAEDILFKDYDSIVKWVESVSTVTDTSRMPK